MFRPYSAPLFLCRIVLILGLLPAALMAQPPAHWSQAAYAYNAKNTPLKQVLKDFADSFGVRLVTSGTLSGTSDGWIRADSANAFLDRLAVKYKLQWFVYNNKLYVSPISENVIKRIEISQDSAMDLKRALKGLGLLEEKFGWGEMNDEGAILISGPRQYVNLVQSLIKVKQKKENGREEIMVFPLRHASVQDREIVIREQRVVIPGVATIMRNLLEKKRQNNTALPTQLPGAGTDTLKQMEDAAFERLQSSPWQKQTEQPSTRSRHGIRVEADVRTNALLIHDDTSRRAYYEEVIATLDIPQHLIEIEAIIVDIDRNRLKELGVDWQAINDGRGIASNISGIGQNPVSQFAQGSATMLITDIGRFYASLRLLESQGEASVVANPSVLTIENQPAVIDLSETAYIETVGERVANVLPVTAGTMLRVTPRNIQGEGHARIELVVDIEDGLIEQTDPSQPPRIKRNSIATKAVIDKDYSLVVGGYHRQEQTRQQNKMPILGDIPLLGALFTSEDEGISQRERLFILTPHISGYRHQSAQYSSMDDSGLIDRHLQRTALRHRDAVSMVEQVGQVFSHLAREQLPAGFKLGTSSEKPYCAQHGIAFDFNHGRTLQGADIQVHVGTLTNTTQAMLSVKEKHCRLRDLIAVAIWPGSELAPGQRAEIYVAQARHAQHQSFARLPSLLSPNEQGGSH